MGIFFGTDGIRGKALEELSFDLAYKCGNAISQIKPHCNVLIGRDSRTSGSYLTNSFAVGAMGLGAKIIDIGVCTTPCVAYLTKLLNCDFGVMISASHNSAEYNGIKIFGNDGFKLGDKKEEELERKFINQKVLSYEKLGEYNQNFNYVQFYINHLKKVAGEDLAGLKIVVDASNGGAYKIAPKIFKSLGAKVIEIACECDGVNINNNCGSLYPQKMIDAVIKNKADVGFCFDGDADRIIAADENGNILDGDILLYILAKHFKAINNLSHNMVVGTRHTNMALEENLKEYGINLIRSDIGDKYVLEQMLKHSLNLGGEKSGHIIMSDYSTTGDGVLCALFICSIIKQQNIKISELAGVKLYPQINIDVAVSDKIKVINSLSLQDEILKQENILGSGARIMVRVSGTEPKIRIMVEARDENFAKNSAKAIEEVVKKVDGGLCVE